MLQKFYVMYCWDYFTVALTMSVKNILLTAPREKFCEA